MVFYCVAVSLQRLFTWARAAMARRWTFAWPQQLFSNNKAEATLINYPQPLLIVKGFTVAENLARAGNIWLAPCDWAHHEPFLREVSMGLLVHCLDPHCRNSVGVVARANACRVPVVVFSFGYAPHKHLMHSAFTRVAESLARGENVCFYCLQSKHRSPGTLCAFLIWLGVRYEAAVNSIYEHQWTRFDQFNNVTDLLLLSRDLAPAPNIVRQGPAVAAAGAAGGLDRPARGAAGGLAPVAAAGAAGVLDRPAAQTFLALLDAPRVDGWIEPSVSPDVEVASASPEVEAAPPQAASQSAATSSSAGVASAALDGASCPVASAAVDGAGVASAAVDGASCPPPLNRKPGLVFVTKTGGRVVAFSNDTLPGLVAKTGLRPREIMRQIKAQKAIYNLAS
jgi:hypothetical protein